jgi:uncharacterized cupredoxin-like copper-binding protein
LQRVRLALVLLSLAAAGVAAPFAISAIRGPASTSASATTVTIKVTATEFKFAMSRKSLAKPATVIFKVKNNGKIAHDFKINGKKTRTIAPGQTVTLKVVFRAKKKYGFLCTLPGHATAGMKGTFSVGVKTTTTTTTVSTTTGGTTGTTGTTTTGGGSSCSTPTRTVNVGMREYAFDMDQTSFPAGCVQFVIKNNGTELHNFDIAGVKAGAILNPGGTETWSVNLSAGSKTAQCDVPFHIDRGMIRTFTVT